METQKSPGLKEKIGEIINTTKTYWHKPPEGQYVSYKEVGFLSGAGFGVHWMMLLASTISLSVGNYIVGASINIEGVHLQLMMNIANIIGIPIGIFRGWYIDNHKLKGGKFLPFIKLTALPIVLLSTLFVWMPYEHMDYLTKCIVVEIIFLLMSICTGFYNEAYTFFQQVISPDSQERAKVLSISQVIYSLAPTLSTAIVPTVAALTWGRDNIWTYRVIYPIFSVVGLIISSIFFRKVKERIILPKTKPEPVRMFDAIREVAKNKYYWIIHAAAWVVFLESGYGYVLTWIFNYANDGNYRIYEGLVNTIIGNAALWAMLLCPLAIKTLGKRNMLILSNTFNILFIVMFYFSYENLIIVCVLWYLNNFISTFWNIIQLNVSADMRDYHQWKTGVRVDGLFGPLGIIGTIIGFFTGYFYPVVLKKLGLEADYTVLYDDTIRNNIFEALLICSAVGAFLNLVPFLFYDLTENKHKGYVEVLKIRAMFINHSIGKLEDEELCEAMDIINTARELYGKEKTPLDKSGIRQARKLPKKTEEEKNARYAAIVKAKAEYNEVKERNLAIERAGTIIDDLNKFSTKAGLIRIKEAEKIVEMGELCIYKNVKEELKNAKALPKTTKEEKEIRNDAIALARAKKQANALITKYSYDGVRKPDESVKTELQEREANSFFESMQIRKELKAYAKAVSIHDRAKKPFSDAQILLLQAQHYTHLQELEQRAMNINKAE